ncbi:glycosyltransferase family 2 protein [Streptococcus suis]
MKKLVSIVLPVYNVENYILDCLDSIKAQTYSNFEVIIINDGSKDRSVEYCLDYCNQDSRFKIIHKPNGGLSDARNVGIEHTRGDYLVFIDSDDFVSPNLLSHLVDTLESNQSDIAIIDPVHYYSNREYINKDIFIAQTKLKNFNRDDALQEMFYQKSFLVSAWGKLYRKELFNGIQFPIGKLFEDSAIMYLLFDKCKTITYSDAKLYAYVHRDDSITTKKFSERDLDILEITDSILDHYRKQSNIYKSAVAYKTSACFRILLNAPNEPKFENVKNQCKQFILSNWKSILFDKNVRLKNKLALILVRFFSPFVSFIYARVNRWE